MGLEYEVAAIDPSLQNYEIVVASSNNSAVENISKELPLYAKIDKIYHEEIKFFDWLANDEDNDKNWGIFTAVLGRSANRQAFMDKFWKPEFASFKTNESYKCKTMFQYLNLLKGKQEAHTLKHLIPDYYSSPTLIKETWQKECKYFNQLHQEILDINKAIEKIISLNK
ncbi:hypothetical protein [Rickettsia endosymbiont of Gonocerus acuteangulatus]|uniref:hypothetical protein n=1 Tax=Rickettsia endosymbiont of Gonocerus acuteangulatus TaxID=3066266 RepID=UPI003132FB78